MNQPLRGLLISQFCGAFNDNAWKLIVALLAIRHVGQALQPGAAFEAVSHSRITLAFVIFTIPLVLISPFAGILSDRRSKRAVIIALKAVEVGLMLAATLTLFLDPKDSMLPLLVLGLLGVQTALFSPAKYGILPELVAHERLSAGNGLLELWTFVAIIAGTAAAGPLLDVAHGAPWLAGLALTIVAAIGLTAAWTIPPVRAARNEGGLVASLLAAFGAIRADRVLRLAVLGAAAYWTLASLVGQDILIYTKSALRLSDSTSGLPLAVLAGGIGIGAVLAGKLSASKVEYGLIPLGATALAVTLLALGILSPGLTGTMIGMTVLGLSSGFVLVPINALIQWRSPGEFRGAVIALSNTFVFAGILLGSLGSGALAQLGLSATQILVAAGLVTIFLTGWALWLLPNAFLRLLLVLLTQTFYRLRVVGRAHVPLEGGALLIANHVSFVDAVLLIASVDRPIRFLVHAAYYHHPVFKPLARLSGAVPIASTGSPRDILRSIREAGHLLDQGQLVCIFAEGQITRTGTLLPFRSGFERIVKGRRAPIIPVHLDRLWGSIFSFVGGRFFTKWPERIPYPVTVSFGRPLPPDTSAADVRQAVQVLAETAWRLRKADRPPLHRSAVRALRRHPLRLAFADLTRPKVSCFQALVGVIALARVLRSPWNDQRTVGVLLPPSVGGALVNMAATLSGRTTVNLNYTAGRTGMASAIERAALRTVVTSRLFVEKANLELPEQVTYLWMEDIRPRIGTRHKLVAMVLALLAPVRLLERFAGAKRPPTIDDLATVIFSSGSTGEPKGVMLSHFSIESNVNSVAQVFRVSPEDRLMGILPFFHSFGYLTTLWFAAIHGVAVIFHPTPLDGAAIGELVHKYRITILMTTPTFLQLYLRRCAPEQFGSLRVVLTGAEKLPERLAQAFEDRFGIRPIEGYGVTECAPVIAVNCPDFRAAGFFQPGTKRGTVGQPIPGVAVRIVDPETYEPLPVGTAGLLLVRGPNVMNGYLGRDDLTAEVMRDGWYVTGDIAMLDEEGFLRITDRLSRFSKIGGEMVPHGTVEEALHLAAGADTTVFAVTSVPDEKKGERLAVLHTLDEASISPILEKVVASGLPNLFVPRRDHFIKVDGIPVLGTGKLDLRAVKRVAQDRLTQRA